MVSLTALFKNEEEKKDEDGSDDDSGTYYYNTEASGTRLQRREPPSGSRLPDTLQTSHLLLYERFKAYQDYMLGNQRLVILTIITLRNQTADVSPPVLVCVGDCKPSEVKDFTADYLEKTVEPCDWLALWSTDIFDVLVEVTFH